MLHPPQSPGVCRVAEEEERVRVGGNEEGVGGGAQSLNFEVIPSSLTETHLGGKSFIIYLCPPIPVMLGVLGSVHRSWGKL